MGTNTNTEEEGCPWWIVNSIIGISLCTIFILIIYYVCKKLNGDEASMYFGNLSNYAYMGQCDVYPC